MSLDSPYRGLAAFDDSDLDALYFFGRERDSEIVVANLIASRLTVLYGPSGVGKSSVFAALRGAADFEGLATFSGRDVRDLAPSTWLAWAGQH